MIPFILLPTYRVQTELRDIQTRNLGTGLGSETLRTCIFGYLFTDHAECLSLLSSHNPSTKLARWAVTFQEVNLTINHQCGKKNTNADALN